MVGTVAGALVTLLLPDDWRVIGGGGGVGGGEIDKVYDEGGREL